jgi:hypothetical protein
MTRTLCAAAAVLACLAWCAPDGAAQGAGGWGTVKGRIVWGGAEIPKRPPLNVTKDKQHCLAKGALLDDGLVVNPKDRGLQGVVIWLAPAPGNAALDIHPSLKAIKEKTVVIDQPMCAFVPNVVALREGQELLVKNSAPVNHNVNVIGDGVTNRGGNSLILAGKSHTVKGLKPQRLPLPIKCDLHPWMEGRVAVFDHPYFAVTDDSGNFEIKLAPAGQLRLFVNQFRIGWRGGTKGRNGEAVTVKAGGVTDLGDLKMGGE